MSDYAVFHDANRHSCIRVQIGHKHTKFIPFEAAELSVKSLTNAEFDRTYTELPDYAPQRAAEIYLFDPDGVKREVSSEARAHLERLAGKPYRKEVLPAEEAPAPVHQPKKERTMTEAAQAAAPAKRKAPAKTAAEAPAPAKKAAKKEEPKKGAPTKGASKKGEAAEPAGRGRAPNIAGTAKIKILVKENPKRGGAADRYALYKNGMTVDEYIAAGGKRADVNWDVAQGFIEVK